MAKDGVFADFVLGKGGKYTIYLDDGSDDLRNEWRGETDRAQTRVKKRAYLETCNRYTIEVPSHFGYTSSELLSAGTLLDLKEGRCVVLNSRVHYLDRTCQGYKDYIKKFDGHKLKFSGDEDENAREREITDEAREEEKEEEEKE